MQKGNEKDFTQKALQPREGGNSAHIEDRAIQIYYFIPITLTTTKNCDSCTLYLKKMKVSVVRSID